MNLFYSNHIEDSTAFLNESESHHCIKVLRMKKGDGIYFIDGAGGYYTGVLETDNPRGCKISIMESKKNYEKRPYFLHIAIAPTKNAERFEWFVEKATEIGVDKITPLICEHSERKTLRPDRVEKVVLSAVKQSVKAWIPEIAPLETMSDFIRKEHSLTENFIAHCGEGMKTSLLLAEGQRSSYLVLIGPEGDFSEKEILLAQSFGFIPVSLGESRLRTETAGVVAAQIIADIEAIKAEKKEI